MRVIVIALLTVSLGTLAMINVVSSLTEPNRVEFSTELSLALVEPDAGWASGQIIEVGNRPFGAEGGSPVVINGVEVVVSGLVNADVDENGNGLLDGAFLFAAVDGAGSWEGRFSGTVANGLISARFVGHGTGELADTKIRGAYDEYETEPESEPESVLSDPGAGILAGEVVEDAS